MVSAHGQHVRHGEYRDGAAEGVYVTRKSSSADSSLPAKREVEAVVTTLDHRREFDMEVILAAALSADSEEWAVQVKLVGLDGEAKMMWELVQRIYGDAPAYLASR